ELHPQAPLHAQNPPAALEGRQAGGAAGSAVGRRAVAHRRLARARSLRPVRRLVHRPPGFDPHPALGGLARAPAAQGLRIPLGIPRDPLPLTTVSPRPEGGVPYKRSLRSRRNEENTAWPL